ncbi:hypothetical protein [Halomicrobium urmianum]|uniref:hypothetical protein n=1 Tax=Halomicrobium urmianum TaxID=1586233 RepID=UPI001CD9D80D|nr:hypothetical protein [Halomicrobium urmianum]
MVRFYGGSGGGWDYVQAAEPTDPDVGESWYVTDADPDGDGTSEGEAKVYGSDGTWKVTGYISHDNLKHVAPADHHDPVTVSAPLTRSQQALAFAFADGLTLDANDDLAVDLGNGLTMDANGQVQIPAGAIGPTEAALGNALAGDGSGNIAVQEGNIALSNLSGYPVGTGDLSFDTATQNELDNHASNNSAHHSRYSDSEARTAVDGANVSISGDADTVDGQHASDLREWVLLDSATDSDSGSQMDVTLSGGGYDEYRAIVDIVGHGGGSNQYCRMRINGITSSDYQYKYYDDTDGHGEVTSDSFSLHTFWEGYPAHSETRIVPFDNNPALARATGVSNARYMIQGYGPQVTDVNSVRLYDPNDPSTGQAFLYGRNRQ